MKLVTPITPIPPELTGYRFEPGNGTSYDLLFGGLPDGRVLLAWLYNGGSGGGVFRFDPDSFLHHSYLSEKMPLTYGGLVGDVAALLVFLSGFGIEVGLPSEADNHTLNPQTYTTN
jgi:hypothetical protein